MDLFGVGIGELVIIALLLLIVAGPKRSAEWARQAGIYVNKMRQLWNRMMQDLRNELGDDADQFIKTAHDLRRTASDLREQTSVRNIAGQAIRLSANSEKNRPIKPAQNGESSTAMPQAESSRYPAWVKTETPQNEEQTEETESSVTPLPPEIIPEDRGESPSWLPSKHLKNKTSPPVEIDRDDENIASTKEEQD